MIPETEIAKMKERVEKATRGPWSTPRGGTVVRAVVWNYEPTVADCGNSVVLTDPERFDNAEFIAAARTDIPALLAERSELLSKIEEQSRELVRLREGWVSVKDGMPPENVEVLCCCPDGEAWIDYWESFADGPEWGADCEARIPTHWMPLPAPPVMEKQGVPVVDVPKVGE